MTDRRLVNAIEEAKRQQALVWSGLRQAGQILDAVNPQGILDVIAAENGWDSADPDMERKRQLLEAAAQFLREWNRIRTEALAEKDGL